jgi:hypothetical protein
MLHERYEFLCGADVRSILLEGIQRGLDARRDAEDMEIGEMSGAVVDGDGSTAGKEVQHGEHPSSRIEVEDEMSEFDMSQFVNFDVKTMEGKDGAPAQATETPSKKADEEFGDDIDDMLLSM